MFGCQVVQMELPGGTLLHTLVDCGSSSCMTSSNYKPGDK